MADYKGDLAEDATLTFWWSTAGADGASITRATDGTVSVYKDNSDTQSVAGVTDSEDADSLTGCHRCVIDTSADAFYATGSNYAVVLSAATVDGQTVNAVIAEFSIENRFREVDLQTIKGQAVTCAAGVTVGAYVGGAAVAPTAEQIVDEWKTQSQADPTKFHVNVKYFDNSAVEYDLYGNLAVGVKSWADVGVTYSSFGNYPVVAIAEWNDVLLSTTNPLPNAAPGTAGGLFIAGANAATTVNITGDLSGSVGSVTTKTGYSLSSTGADLILKTSTFALAIADAIWDEAVAGHVGIGTFGKTDADILADTNELQTNQGNWLTATGFSTHDAAAVVTALGTGSTLTACLTATSVTVSDKTGFSLASTGLDLVTAWTVDITGTVSGNSTHDAAAVVTALGTGSTLTALAPAATALSSAVWTAQKAGYLDAAVSTAGGDDAETVADAVWDELLAGHVIAGSAGVALAAAGTAGDPWIGELPGAYAEGTAGYIIGTYLDAAVSDAAGNVTVEGFTLAALKELCQTNTTLSVVSAGSVASLARAILGSSIQIKSVSADDEPIEIEQGRSYRIAAGNEIYCQNSSGDWYNGDISGLTPKLRIWSTEDQSVQYLVTGEIQSATGTQRVEFDLLSAQTATLVSGSKYRYGAFLADGIEEYPLARGVVVVIDSGASSKV